MKNKNVIIDLISSVFLFISSFSAIIVWLILPSGQGFKKSGYSLFLNLSRHDWSDIHIASSLIFLGFIIIHLILHWQIIKSLFLNKK
ncbi:MAG TPA: DUF4405 domain-containing protein [Candidatus Pacearchaeota archaeon]|nr:DUF4405 domain-containing protein [Candidatus Pacearchaeota archaeon]HPR80068.1 DUF4405 domain-containing protein [Candidatus Pacearchaeota archaeon]